MLYSTTIATSIKYGNYTHLQSNTNAIQVILKAYMSKIKQHIDYKDGVVFKIRPIKGRTQGQAFSKTNLIEIDPRTFSITDPTYHIKLLEVICHELVHSEQYKQNRLSFVDARTARFEGSDFRLTQSFRDYYNSPWEVEARRRGESVTKLILS